MPRLKSSYLDVKTRNWRHVVEASFVNVIVDVGILALTFSQSWKILVFDSVIEAVFTF